MMKIYSLLVLLPACRAGDDDAMLQVRAAHEAIRSDCPPIPEDFLPTKKGFRVVSDCSIWLEGCLGAKLKLNTRKRWRHKWKQRRQAGEDPMTKDWWLREGRIGNGVTTVAHFMQDCGKTYCCSGNHRFADDEECKQQMEEEAALHDERLDRVYHNSIQHTSYPLAIVSRMLCRRIVDHIAPNAANNAQLLGRGAWLHDTVTEGKGDGQVGGKDSNVSLASLSTSRTSCIQPPDTHPEGWDCKCHVRMKDECEQVYNGLDLNVNDCYKAHICNNDNVCGLWKEDVRHCPMTQEFQDLRNLLRQHSGLLQKQEDVIEEATGLEGSLQGKGCY